MIGVVWGWEGTRGERRCDLENRKGRLRAGYDADLLLVDGDPLADIGALRRVSAVILRGAMADLGQRSSRPA
jgi:imidazolonepropionase-like amidohydrolase